jgi:hypothetical protein
MHTHYPPEQVFGQLFMYPRRDATAFACRLGFPAVFARELDAISATQNETWCRSDSSVALSGLGITFVMGSTSDRAML